MDGWPHLDEAYEMCVQWTPQTFNLRAHAGGRAHLGWLSEEMAFWLERMGSGSFPADSAAAAKVLAIIPSLVLQKPRRAVGLHGVDRCLNQRIHWWKNGELDRLWDEARRSAERRARQAGGRPKAPSDETVAERIAHLVRSGDIRGANATLDPGKRGKGLPVEVTPELRRKLEVTWGTRQAALTS